MALKTYHRERRITTTESCSRGTPHPFGGGAGGGGCRGAAMAIVDILLNEKVPECPLQVEKRMSVAPPDDFVPGEKPELGDNYPDPFSDNTKIPCFLPEGKHGKLIIRNLIGLTFIELNIEAGLQVLEIQGGDLPNGMYLYSLEMDNRVIATKKMIILK